MIPITFGWAIEKKILRKKIHLRILGKRKEITRNHHLGGSFAYDFVCSANLGVQPSDGKRKFLF